VAAEAGKGAERVHLMNNSEAHPVPAPADTPFLPGPVLLLGAPGVGKGTQAQLLMAEFDIPQISTGDLLRDHRARHTPLGMLAEDLMSQGQLVPDDLVNEMVADRLTQPDTRPGYILDGFPRTLFQAAWLDHHLSGTGEHGSMLPVVAISITVDYDQLLHRITGRRTCPVCKSIYNTFSNPPQIAGVCDNEGAALLQRSDDTEEVFAERMKTFDLQTAPVIDHYRAQGRFEEVNGDQTVEQVTAAIAAALMRLRDQHRVQV
jgi:adenylate kinase